MSRISSQSKVVRGLVVKGTGYSSSYTQKAGVLNGGPFRSATTSSGSSANRCGPLRRAGSVGSVATTSSAASGNNRPPPNRVRRSSAATAATASNPFTSAGCPGGQYSTSGDRQGLVICNCQHPADISFLENIYVQNLQTQIEVLELENTYLRSGAVGESGGGGERADRSSSHTNHHHYRHHSASQKRKSTQPHVGETADDQVPERREADETNYHHSHAWYPSAPSTSSAAGGAGAVPTPSQKSQTRKRVGFTEDHYYHHYPGGSDAGDGGSGASLRVNAQQFARSATSGREAKEAMRRSGGRDDEYDEDLFLQLEQAFQNEHILEEKLKAQMEENRRLISTQNELEARIRSYEGKLSRERRTLLEDNTELQRRLDELTPILAEKEARLAKLEEEGEAYATRLRDANTKITSLQAQLEERKREGELYTELESDQRAKNERLRDKLRAMEADLHAQSANEKLLNNEIALLKKTLRDTEAALGEERANYDRVAEESRTLHSTNAQLQERAEKAERRVEELRRDVVASRQLDQVERALAEAKQTEATLRAEMRRLVEKLEHEKDNSSALNEQLKELAAKEEEHRDARQRMLKELEALRALSHSLTNENRGLREERISMEEHVQLLKKKVFKKERNVQELTEKLEEFKRKYVDAINRLSLEIARQNETSDELEEIVQKVHDLSNSIPRRIVTPPPPPMDAPSAQSSTSMGSTAPLTRAAFVEHQLRRFNTATPLRPVPIDRQTTTIPEEDELMESARRSTDTATPPSAKTAHRGGIGAVGRRRRSTADADRLASSSSSTMKTSDMQVNIVTSAKAAASSSNSDITTTTRRQRLQQTTTFHRHSLPSAKMKVNGSNGDNDDDGDDERRKRPSLHRRTHSAQNSGGAEDDDGSDDPDGIRKTNRNERDAAQSAVTDSSSSSPLSVDVDLEFGDRGGHRQQHKARHHRHQSKSDAINKCSGGEETSKSTDSAKRAQDRVEEAPGGNTSQNANVCLAGGPDESLHHRPIRLFPAGQQSTPSPLLRQQQQQQQQQQRDELMAQRYRKKIS